MLRQNFGQEPTNEQTRISQSEMRQIIDLYDQQIGISTRSSSAAPRLESTSESPTLADVAELLGITPSEAQRLLNQSREQKTASTTSTNTVKRVPLPPVTTFSPQPVTVVQNVIVDSHAELFQRFDENHGQFVPTWNWGAFLFGPFWYLYKGMWAKALIYTMLGLLAAIFTWGGGGLVFSIALAVLGNYDYYLLRCNRTQLWDKRREYTTVSNTYQASVNRVATTFPAPSVATSQPTGNANLDQMEQKLRLLREAYERGLLNSVEFEEKRLGLLNEVENQANLKTLSEAHRMGLLSDAEYLAKRQALLER